MTQSKKIAILGGGFAGVAAAKALRSIPSDYEIHLFDQFSFTTMLPSLPDLAGKKLKEEFLVEDIAKLVPSRVNLHKEKVQRLDLPNNRFDTDRGSYHFSHLILALGSVTNFYQYSSDARVRDCFHTADTIDQARNISEAFDSYLNETASEPKSVVLIGAGYTGLELAISLRIRAKTLNIPVKIVILEVGKDILPMLSQKERTYVKKYLWDQDIEILTETKVSEVKPREIKTTAGQVFANSFLCWTAGSTLSLAELVGGVERLPDGRILVNEFQQIPGYSNVFAAGDAAATKWKGSVLRKSVNFSIWTGSRAGKNIARIINGKQPEPFWCLDLGWVIPLHEISVGRMFTSIPLRGHLGLIVHYAMCGFRNFSFRNFLYFLKVALTPTHMHRD